MLFPFLSRVNILLISDCSLMLYKQTVVSPPIYFGAICNDVHPESLVAPKKDSHVLTIEPHNG